MPKRKGKPPVEVLKGEIGEEVTEAGHRGTPPIDERMDAIEGEVGTHVARLMAGNRASIVAMMEDTAEGKIKIGFIVDVTCGPANKITTQMSFARRTKAKIVSVMDPNQPDLFRRDEETGDADFEE